MRTIGEHHVRLDDGTVWAVDRERGDEVSLEWVLRYGSSEDIYAQRMNIASCLASYKALLFRPQKRCAQVMRDLRNALDEWETQVQGDDSRNKKEEPTR